MAQDNPDQQLLHAFLRAPGVPVPVDTNPVARDLAAVLLGWDAASGTLRMGFTTAPRHVQGNGAVHGGVVTTLLDFGLAFTALARLPAGQVAVTAALNVQFERAVQPEALVVNARVDRLGSRLAFASATLHAPNDTVLARATATLAVLA